MTHKTFSQYAKELQIYSLRICLPPWIQEWFGQSKSL